MPISNEQLEELEARSESIEYEDSSSFHEDDLDTTANSEMYIEEETEVSLPVWSLQWAVSALRVWCVCATYSRMSGVGIGLLWEIDIASSAHVLLLLKIILHSSWTDQMTQ